MFKIKNQSKQNRTPPIAHRHGIAPSFLVLPAGSWERLLDFLWVRFPHLPPQQLAGRLERGEIFDQQGQALNKDSPFQPHTCIWYYREVAQETPVPFDAPILFQDDYLLVADKPHFLSCIPAGRHLKETLLSRLRVHLDMPQLTPIHRLDRETAGVMVFCLKPHARGAYQTLFEQQQVRKEYEAIAPWRKDLCLPYTHRSCLQEGRDFFTMQEVAGEPNSCTEISLIERLDGTLAHYRLQPTTGKKHQLRAHMAALGIPILNDPWYPTLQAAKGDDFSQPLQLLARKIAFVDPITQQLRAFSSRRQLQCNLV